MSDEQDHMDRLLSQALSAPVPELSSGFDRHLTRRLQPPRLDRQGRFVLSVFAVFAIVVSVWTMRAASIEWSMVAASTLGPLVITVVLFRRYVRPPAFG
jgi:hypothetical protein